MVIRRSASALALILARQAYDVEAVVARHPLYGTPLVAEDRVE